MEVVVIVTLASGFPHVLFTVRDELCHDGINRLLNR